MIDQRKRNVNWQVADTNGDVKSWDQAMVAVLMDIRDELKQLNHVFGCANFLAIPMTLNRIDNNTRKPRKKAGPK